MISVGETVTVMSMSGKPHVTVAESPPRPLSMSALIARYPSGDPEGPFVFVLGENAEGVTWIRGSDPAAVSALVTAWALHPDVIRG